MVGMTKYCGSCKSDLDLAAFAKNRSRYDGLQNYCRACSNAATMRSISKDRTKSRERALRYKATHKEEVKAREYAWYWNNRETEIARRLQHLKDNPELHSNNSQKRRARLANNGVFYVSKKELVNLYSRPCFYCGAKQNITLDHVVPIARGGRHSIGNLVAACKSCNSSKHKKFIMEWKLIVVGFSDTI